MDSTAFIKSFALKLGLRDNDIILRAAEYMRHLRSWQHIQINTTMQIIVSLAIAAEQLGMEFDKASALKMYNFTKIKYNRAFLIVKKLLNVNNPKTMHEISVQLGCEPASKLAADLLIKYKENDTIERDFQHPMYSAVAVYTICKLKKITVKKQHCISLSNLQPQQWGKLEVEFKKFAEKHGFAKEDVKKVPKKRLNEFLSSLEERSKEYDKEFVKKTQEDTSNVESYLCWRTRILEEAYAHVKPK